MFRLVHRGFCALVFGFLVLPLVVIVPLSFNAEPYFTFTSDMLALRPEGFSLRWYHDIIENGMARPDQAKWTAAYLLDAWYNANWLQAARNSIFLGLCATLLATAIGTLAALGLSEANFPHRRMIIAAILSPMIVPIVITSAAFYFFFSSVGLSHTYLGIIMAHALLGVPFVVITVLATLSNFDAALTRAAATLGANPFTTFRRITLPLIMPGVATGALFAFITSFDEVVAVIFLAGSGAAHDPPPDVVGHPRADQPDNSGRRDDPDNFLDGAAARGGTPPGSIAKAGRRPGGNIGP